jgi:hypothetical protein
MKKVIFYHFCFLAVISLLMIWLHIGPMPLGIESFKLLATCVLLGGYGGVVYCLRGVYLNASVKGEWLPQWEPWYYIRPVVSLICGGVSFLFLKAGLLLLEAASLPDSSDLGFMALAFIAGLNVDKFINKIEEIAQASWGIEKSRTSTRE